MTINKPILTIAIPTYNRATYLVETLKQLQLELSACQDFNVEILISDNASEDNTKEIVNQYIKILDIRYIINRKNIGSDKNFAQCFNEAKGHYVLLLGDDDILFDGALLKLLKILKSKKNGVVCMRPYGFDQDFRSEFPGHIGKNLIFTELNSFLIKINALMTLISACLINKHLISHIDANDYCGSNLIQVNLLIEAAKKAKQNMYISTYMIACKRNNSGGFNSRIFVKNLGDILDGFKSRGLSDRDIKKINFRLMLSYYPQYLLKFVFYHQKNSKKMPSSHANGFSSDIDYDDFYKRYRSQTSFYIFIYPFFKFPRSLAIVWGAILLLIGRLFNGDFLRGIKFTLNKIRF
jgi:abequosyltransferase